MRRQPGLAEQAAAVALRHDGVVVRGDVEEQLGQLGTSVVRKSAATKRPSATRWLRWINANLSTAQVDVVDATGARREGLPGLPRPSCSTGSPGCRSPRRRPPWRRSAARRRRGTRCRRDRARRRGRRADPNRVARRRVEQRRAFAAARSASHRAIGAGSEIGTCSGRAIDGAAASVYPVNARESGPQLRLGEPALGRLAGFRHPERVPHPGTDGGQGATSRRAASTARTLRNSEW